MGRKSAKPRPPGRRGLRAGCAGSGRPGRWRQKSVRWAARSILAKDEGCESVGATRVAEIRVRTFPPRLVHQGTIRRGRQEPLPEIGLRVEPKILGRDGLSRAVAVVVVAREDGEAPWSEQRCDVPHETFIILNVLEDRCGKYDVVTAFDCGRLCEERMEVVVESRVDVFKPNAHRFKACGAVSPKPTANGLKPGAAVSSKPPTQRIPDAGRAAANLSTVSKTNACWIFARGI